MYSGSVFGESGRFGAVIGSIGVVCCGDAAHRGCQDVAVGVDVDGGGLLSE